MMHGSTNIKFIEQYVRLLFTISLVGRENSKKKLLLWNHLSFGVLVNSVHFFLNLTLKFMSLLHSSVGHTIPTFTVIHHLH